MRKKTPFISQLEIQQIEEEYKNAVYTADGLLTLPRNDPFFAADDYDDLAPKVRKDGSPIIN